MPEDNPTILRICRGLCGQEKPLGQFPVTRGRRFYRCATCVLAQNLAYQRAHKERYGEIKRAWIERNPEKHKAALVDARLAKSPRLGSDDRSKNGANR